MKKLIAIIFLSGIASLSTATAQTKALDTVKKIEIKVTNLHCGNDMPTIKKRLLNQDGIDEVIFTDISSESSMFTVTYHSSVTNQQNIEKAIDQHPAATTKVRLLIR